MVETTSYENETDKEVQQQTGAEKSYSAAGASFAAPQEQEEDLSLTATDADYADVLGTKQMPVETVNFSGLVMDLEDHIKKITKLTYADKSKVIRALYAAGYALGVTTPEKQIYKKIDKLEAHGQVLENHIERYQREIDKTDAAVITAQESLHKAMKVREDIKMKIGDLETELAREKQETDQTRAAYANAPAEDKPKCKQLINGYLESQYKKNGELRAEKNKLRNASRCFNKRFSTVGRLESRRIKYENVVQSMYKLESQNLWLIEQFKDVIENKDLSQIEILRELTRIGKEVSNLAREEQAFAKQVQEMPEIFGKLPDGMNALTNMEQRDSERLEMNERLSKTADDDIMLADKLTEKMYMPNKAVKSKQA